MDRPSWIDIGLLMAIVAATRSYDDKVRVGAAIMSNVSHAPISTGYNGRAPGESNRRESMEQGRSGFIHAEENAILRADWKPGESHTIFCTHEPCEHCARLIIATGRIDNVYYLRPYHDEWRRERQFPSGSTILLRHPSKLIHAELRPPPALHYLLQYYQQNEFSLR